MTRGFAVIDLETTGLLLQKHDRIVEVAIGDTVVITGETRRERAAWFEMLSQRQFAPKDSLVKKAKVLVAADPDSMSGKARQARAWGIPIINEAGLERLLGLPASGRR
ncbi:hypothetical protein [Microbacterium radiodurans]|uniref:BRCT domain-containing protein n=1 Tax=Microbacterium radiodurans TaxID=661398 RepID=A0A5J5IRZ5_9MICO|nr:hypothetical protein [Microbacterium radiodurans]KAA9085430.1 hypothetical protein F6B42_13285 [Microbacterium radiodurans]